MGVSELRIEIAPRPLDEALLELDVAELRDSVNNARTINDRSRAVAGLPSRK